MRARHPRTNLNAPRCDIDGVPVVVSLWCMWLSDTAQMVFVRICTDYYTENVAGNFGGSCRGDGGGAWSAACVGLVAIVMIGVRRRPRSNYR